MTPITDEVFYHALGMVFRKHKLGIEHLTQQQFVECIRQTIACGDFVRLVQVDSGGQSVVYIPFAKEEKLKSRIRELEAQVDTLTSKFPNDNKA